jgi:hypothetical protein
MVSYANSNGKSRILGAEKIEVISTENDFAGVYSILPICHIYICIFPSGQSFGSPFLASYCGNNSGTDML